MPGRFIFDVFEKLGDATKPQVVSEVLGGNLDSHCHFTLLYSCGQGISFRRRLYFWKRGPCFGHCILFPFAYPQSSCAKSFFFNEVSCLDSLLEFHN